MVKTSVTAVQQASGLQPYLLILVTEWPPDLHTRILVGIMYDDVVAVPSDIHRTEEIRTVKQQGMGQACYGSCGHFEGCHGCSVVSPLHGNLHSNSISTVRPAAELETLFSYQTAAVCYLYPTLLPYELTADGAVMTQHSSSDALCSGTTAPS